MCVRDLYVRTRFVLNYKGVNGVWDFGGFVFFFFIQAFNVITQKYNYYCGYLKNNVYLNT